MQSIRAISAIAALVALTVACSTNPVTGKKEFNIVSEQQELALGKQAHEQTIEQYGIYDEKPELNRLVSTIGQEIAAASDRPELPWTFTILDTPMVNAMALPGGYIYITRGMLERINSVDELAGILGHEIAHVTARHAAQRISQSQLAQLGLVLGSVVAGPQATQQYGQLAELGASLLFQRYSRQQETQADLVGTAYMAESGYNPVGAERMLMALQRLNKSELTAIDRYFVSHPDPRKRISDVNRKVAEIRAATPGVTFDAPDRNRYLRLLDGMITGNSTMHTTVADRMVYDRRYGMIVDAPAGWTPTAAPGTIFVMQPERDNGSVFVAQDVRFDDLPRARSVDDAVRARLQQMGLQYVGSQEARARTGERFVVDLWTGATQSGNVAVETTQFASGDRAVALMFVSRTLRRGESPLSTMLQRTSFDLNRARRVDPPRIEIGSTRSGDTWASLAQRATGSTRYAETVANINGFSTSEKPPQGSLVKLPQAVVPER